ILEKKIGRRRFVQINFEFYRGRKQCNQQPIRIIKCIIDTSQDWTRTSQERRIVIFCFTKCKESYFFSFDFAKTFINTNIKSYNINICQNRQKEYCKRVEQIDDKEDEELEGITLALLMSITTRRMAEISRAALEVATMTSEQFVLNPTSKKQVAVRSL
ncbi:MAG: hypothetical protein EZS28_051740, partial [Streblomastix strix]